MKKKTDLKSSPMILVRQIVCLFNIWALLVFPLQAQMGFSPSQIHQQQFNQANYGNYPAPVYGSSFGPSGGAGFQPRAGGFTGAMQHIIMGTTQQLMAIKRQQMGLAQLQGASQSMDPRGSVTLDKYFSCYVSKSSPPFPENACQPIEDPSQIMQAQFFQRMAIQYDNFFRQLLNENETRNDNPNVGVQCLKNNQAKVHKDLTAMMNYLQARASDVEKQQQLFRDNQRKLLEDMKKTNQELYGAGDGAQEIDAKINQFENLFTPQCRNVLGPKTLSEARTKGGLRGLRDGIVDHNQKAVNYSQNRSIYEADIEKEIRRISQEINTQGAERWGIEGDGIAKGSIGVPGRTRFRGLGIAVQNELQRFLTVRDKVEQQIRRAIPSYQLPPLDENFRADFNLFVQGAKEFFRKQYVHDCVTGKDNLTFSIDINQVIRSLDHRNVGNRGRSVRDYQTTLKAILAADSLFEDKMSRIEQLDREFDFNRDGKSDITYSYEHAERGPITQTPYAFFQEVVQHCTERFNQDDTFSSSYQGRSQKVNTQRAVEYLKELQAAHNKLVPGIGKAIRDQLINCNGTPARAETCSNSADSPVFNTEDQNFCIAHANTCSEQVQACYKEANTEITKRETKLKSGQATYNRAVEELVANQEQALTVIKAQWKASAEYLSKFFPETNYGIPEDLFIKLPEESEESVAMYGVRLRGGGKLDFLNNMKENIKKMQTAIAAQRDNVNKFLDDHIDTARQTIANNQKRWADLKKKCEESENQFRQMANQQNQQRMEDYQEKMGELTEFCHQYDGLRQAGPGPGCEGDNDAASVYESGTKIAGMLGPHSAPIMRQISAYKEICGQYKKRDEEEVDKGNDTNNLADMCGVHRWDTILQNMERKVYDNIPSISKSKIKEYTDDYNSDKSIDDAFGKIDFDVGLLIGYLKNLKRLTAENKKSQDKYRGELEKKVLSKLQVKNLDELKKDEKKLSIYSDVMEAYDDKSNSGSNGLCHAAKNESIYEQYKKCASLTDSDTVDCIEKANDKIANYSGSDIAASTNGWFKKFQQSRSLASEQEWKSMGQNRSDACSSMVQGGRHFNQHYNGLNQSLGFEQYGMPGMNFMQ